MVNRDDQAYGSSRIAGGRVQQILTWPGSFEHFRKVCGFMFSNKHHNNPLLKDSYVLVI